MKGKLLIVVLGLTALFVSGLLITINKSYACPPPPPTPPVAKLEANPERQLVGNSVTLDGSESYSNIVKYEWDFDGNGSYDYTETSSSYPDYTYDGITTHTYNTIGTYTPKLRVTKDNDLKDTDTCTVYVVEVTNLNTEDRYSSIVAAIAADQTADNDIIEVSVGTYKEKLNFTSEIITLRSTDPDDPAVVAATIIDGGVGSGTVVTFGSEDADSTITGFTITNGSASGIYCDGASPTITYCVITGNETGNDGGGMYIKNCTPSISNCTFSGNTGEYGGGLYTDSDCTISDCTFSGNYVFHDGGGMCNKESSPTVTDCDFIGNEAESNGGGMANLDDTVDSTPIVTNCIFEDNEAGINGGGMANYNLSHPTVTNCLFIGNTAAVNGGGGIYNCNQDYDEFVGVYGELLITNCTFVGNGTGKYGAICDFWPSENMQAIATNCIFWDNTVGSGEYAGQIYCEECGEPPPPRRIILNYCCIEGGWSGNSDNQNSNTGVDPQLDEDCNLTSSSTSCIDKGDDYAPSLPEYDIIGNDRTFDAKNDGLPDVDMGAYEYPDLL